MVHNVKQIGEAYRRRWWILLVISLSVLVIIISSSVVNIALPTIQRELGSTMSQLQWIANAYMLTFAGLLLTMGSLGDRIGRNTMLQTGIFVFAAANIASLFAESSGFLIAMRALMGVGAAMILPATLAIITNIFPEGERGKAIGVWAGLNSLGIALGPIIGGVLVDKLAWTSIFFVNLPVACVALVAGIILIPNSRGDDNRRIDIVGTLLSCVAMTALIFGLVQAGSWGWGDPAVIGSLSGGVFLLAMFVLWERSTAYPMFEISFFKRHRFSAGVGGVCIMSLALVGITFSLSIFMQFVRGYTALQTGLRLVPLALGIFFGAGSADKVVKGFGTKAAMATGFAGTAVVGFLTSLTTLGSPYWVLGMIFGGLGLFLGLIAAPATDAIMGAIPKEKAGIGSAMNTASRTLAGAVGVAALGSVLNSVYRSSFSRDVPQIGGLSAEIAESAGESVGAGIIIASRLPAETGSAVATLARESFMDGWRVMAYIACALSVAGLLFILKLMPSNPTVTETLESNQEQDENLERLLS